MDPASAPEASYPRLIKMKVDELVGTDYNPRKITPEALVRLKKSMDELGNLQPITWNVRTRKIVGGHQRLKWYHTKGMKEADVWAVDLSEVQEKAANLALNKLSGEFDLDALRLMVDGLKFENIDIEQTGFSVQELDELIGKIPEEISEDEVPEVPVDAITKLGDLWILGEHRVLCGDSTKAEHVEKLMDGATIESVITDPPFGMNFVSNHRTVKHQAIKGDATVTLLLHACGIRANHSSYVFCRWDNLSQVPTPTSLITWVKNNWSMGDLDHAHARQTEVILFYPGRAHSWPCKRPTDVVQHPRTSNDLHPTQKPTSLIAELIGWSLGLVFDPFLGSGSTLIASEQLGRKCYGMEISPNYCDVIVKRWENLTKKQATKAAL